MPHKEGGCVNRVLFVPREDEVKFRVLEALDAPLKELTVEAICRKSGISKPTFYRHFSSKMDIPVWVSDFMSSKSLDEIGRSLTWQQGLELFFSMGIQLLPYLQNLTVDPGSYAVICKQRTEHRYRAISDTLAMRGVEIDDSFKSTIEGYIKLELHFSEERLDEGRTQDPREVFLVVRPFIPEQLYRALELPAATTRP